MAFQQKIEHSQRAVFAQSLRQSVKILELPLLELKEVIEAELVENPVIEEVQPASSDAGAGDTPAPEKESPADEENTQTIDREIGPQEFANFQKPIAGKKESLMDTLLRQLRINARDDQQLKIGTIIINHIDENGYMRDPIDTICVEAQCNPDEALHVLKIIQDFDPAGVAARDLKECLLIQLEKKKEDNGLLRKIIEDHLEDLARKDSKKLCKKLKCTDEELAQNIAKIHCLEPKPGRGYSSDDTVYVIPDISIEERDETLQILTKDDRLPVIRVNPTYKNMLKSKKVDEETKNFIRLKLQNASSLIRAISSRKSTLTKVVTIIAETQKEALLQGMDKLKPLTLKEIADRVEMHESTISRIVMNKYVQTPIGIFALKDFFSSGLKTAQGENISSHRLKMKIAELVEAEDKKKPLKDQKIADLIMQTEKIPIARRTVVKYRESLKIPPVSQRRLKT